MKKFTFLFFFTILYSSVWGQCSTTAGFIYTYTDCSTIQFIDASTTSAHYNLVKWEWDYGDGTTATGSTVSHTFTPGVSVQVRLIVTADSSGVTCTDTITKAIKVHALPTVYVASDPSPSCVTIPAHFFGSSGQQITSWQWDFGDGKFDTIQNPVHLYPDTGSYQVVLHVIDTNGCASQNNPAYVQKVNSAPALDFTWNVDPAAVVDNLQFTATGQGNVTSWHWDFGDGDTANIQNPTHQYSDTGQYHVTLSIIVDGLCANSLTKVVSIKPLPSPDFSLSPVCLNDTTFFTDLSTTPVGTIRTWKWYFGDGDSLIIYSPDNPNVKHIYRAQTTYLVTLLTINSSGYQRSITKNIDVKLKPVADFVFKNPYYLMSTGFFDKSSPNGGSAIHSWSWNFDDPASGTNDTSYLQNPTHIMSVADTFNVRLIITNNDGCRDTVVHPVVVDTLPSIHFSAQKVCYTQPTHFTASYVPHTDSIAYYTWNFNDGSQKIITYLDTISHVFPYPGTYDVQLSAIDTSGYSSTITQKVVVDSLPVPNFGFITPACDQPTYFTDSSQGGGNFISSWQWNFDDIHSGTDSTSTSQNPSHFYGPMAGIYNVKLIVTNFNGCIDSITKPVIRPSCLTTLFDVNAGNSCADNLVYFKDHSWLHSIHGNITQWKWDFGDGHTQTYQIFVDSVAHSYARSGSYQVMLTVTARVNGIDFSVSYDSVIVINPTPTAAFIASNQCLGGETAFIDQSQGSGASITSWSWYFNDSGTGIDSSILQNPTHVFSKAANFPVQLFVSNNFGCIDSTTQNIDIAQSPQADFAVGKACSGQMVLFSDSSKTFGTQLLNWQWDFNDPYSSRDSSFVQNPTHVYDSAGAFLVQLVVTDNHLCRDTISKLTDIHKTPQASFTVLYNYRGITGQVLMQNKSKGASSYFWDFGDGNTSMEENPVNQYQSGDIYDITLVAISQFQCQDTAIITYDLTLGLFVPNSFAPSSDVPGTNIFQPKGIHLKEYHIEVYSSWGTLLWESSKLTEDGEPAEGWDGTYKGQPMPAGNYIWRVKARFIDNSYWSGSNNGDGNIKPDGTVTLIR